MGELGDKIRELREAKRWSQREASRLLGVSHTRLRAFETGVTYGSRLPAIPNRDLLSRMAERYDYPLDALLGLAGYAMEPSAPVYSDADELELEAIYRRLDPRGRHLLLRFARMLGEE